MLIILIQWQIQFPPTNNTPNAKVLVRLATVNINHALTDSIVIPEGFYSIKGISRRLVLTQCYIVPTANTR